VSDYRSEKKKASKKDKELSNQKVKEFMSRNYTDQVKKIKTAKEATKAPAQKHTRTKSKAQTKHALDKTRSLSRSIQNFATISTLAKKSEFTRKSIICLQAVSSTRNKSFVKMESPYKS